LFHSQIPLKKAALIALTAKNISGAEADRMGLVSMSVPAKDLESTTNKLARQIAGYHLAPLQHHKIAVQMGRDMSLREAIKLDQLVGERQFIAIDPTGDVDGWLKSQKGGPNESYKRPDTT
jgi:3-hydroxypropionyl-coenzyme A dehydratase/trans-feruloyl-CoA hydratase/vanillin synthase